MSAPVTFDLSELADEYDRKARVFRTLCFAVAGLFVLVQAFSIVVLLSRGTFQANLQATNGTVYIGASFGVGICLWGALVTSRGAIRLSIDHQALKFGWSSGRVDILEWQDRKFRLDLIDRSVSDYARGVTRLLWEARRRFRPVTQLSKSAFDGIVDAARSHHLSISTPTQRLYSWGPYQRVRIRGKR